MALMLTMDEISNASLLFVKTHSFPASFLIYLYWRRGCLCIKY
uniref:Uncharacterized protein n=1 Tax=Lepeophtheirus salmonis TaxID=72036 RepID=A0A0K2V496_LEPSM